MIDRLLKGAEGGRRTALLIVLACTTWGCGLLSLAAGWKVGLVVLAVGTVTISILRAGAGRSPMPASASKAAGETDAETADGGDTVQQSTTAEERVLARLAKMGNEAPAER